MNLNLSKILKDSSFDFKDAKSINNWIRVLDTSGMSVVDQLILDNHRRQLLKSLYDEPKQEEKRMYSSMKSKNTSFTSIQSSQTKTSNISIKILNNSFMSIPDPQQCAERLYSDAYYRDSKLKKLQELKDLREKEEALDYLNSRHPKRKLDPEVFNRLTHDERIIKLWYEKEGADPGPNGKSSRRFSVSEQKESVDRLVKSRGNSCKKRLENENSERKMSNEELKAMIERLYKVKDTGHLNACDNRARSAARPRKVMKNRVGNELKRSKRYRESLDKGSEAVVESVCEDFQSPVRDGVKGEELEVKLLMMEQTMRSPVGTEVNAGSPFGLDFRERCENCEPGSILSIHHIEDFSILNRGAIHPDHKSREKEESSGITIKHCLIPEETCKECLETNASLTNGSPNPALSPKMEEFSPEVNENFRDYLRPKEIIDSEYKLSPTGLNPEAKDTLNISSSTLFNSVEKSFQADLKYSDTEYKDTPSSFILDSEEKPLPVGIQFYNNQPEDLLNRSSVNPEEKSSQFDIVSNNTQVKDLSDTTNNGTVSQARIEGSLKSFPLPKSFYLEPEDPSSRDQATTFSQEALYLMQNPLQSMNSESYSPKKVNPCILDSYRFIVGISENDEFIYAD